MQPAFAVTITRALGARSRTTIAPAAKRIAAVLVPLFAIDEAPHCLFIRRAHDLPHHAGQVAFPGGSHEPGHDADVLETALREAHEEVGLRREDVQLLGALDDIETVGSRFVITPFVGLVPYPYDWRPCPHEVDTVFTVPLATLLAPDAERLETWSFGDRRVPIPSFPVDGHVIWGATHQITRNLLDLLSGPARVEGAGPR